MCDSIYFINRDFEQVKDTTDTNDSKSLLRMDSPFDTDGSKSLSTTDSLQMECATSTSHLEQVTAFC